MSDALDAVQLDDLTGGVLLSADSATREIPLEIPPVNHCRVKHYLERAIADFLRTRSDAVASAGRWTGDGRSCRKPTRVASAP